MRNRPLRDDEGARQIDIENALPQVERAIFELDPFDRRPRIVDEDVEPSLFRNQQVDDFRGLRGVVQIGLQDDPVSASMSNIGERPFGSLAALMAMQADECTGCGEFQGDGLPDADPRPGNESDPPLEIMW